MPTGLGIGVGIGFGCPIGRGSAGAGLSSAVMTVAGDGVILTFSAPVQFFGGNTLDVDTNGSPLWTENEYQSDNGPGSVVTVLFAPGTVVYGDVVTLTLGANEFQFVSDSSPVPGVTDFHITNLVLTAPTGVTLTAAGSTSLSIAFTPPSGIVTGYHTKFGTSDPPGTAGADGLASPIIQTGLASGTQYFVQVQAYNAAGSGPLSTSAGKYTLTAAPTYAVAPHDDSSEGISGTIMDPVGETLSQYDYSLNGGSTWAALTNTAGAFDVSTGPGTFSFTVRGYNGDGAPGDQAVPVTVVVLPFELGFAASVITPVSAGPTLFSRAVA